jgi:hypothetical protein
VTLSSNPASQGHFHKDALVLDATFDNTSFVRKWLVMKHVLLSIKGGARL